MQGPHEGNYREKGHINGGKTGAEERNSTKTTEGAQGGEDFITPPNSPTPKQILRRLRTNQKERKTVQYINYQTPLVQIHLTIIRLLRIVRETIRQRIKPLTRIEIQKCTVCHHL